MFLLLSGSGDKAEEVRGEVESASNRKAGRCSSNDSNCEPINSSIGIEVFQSIVEELSELLDSFFCHESRDNCGV